MLFLDSHSLDDLEPRPYRYTVQYVYALCWPVPSCRRNPSAVQCYLCSLHKSVEPSPHALHALHSARQKHPENAPCLAYTRSGRPSSFVFLLRPMHMTRVLAEPFQKRGAVGLEMYA